jgi:hypothetical protein
LKEYLADTMRERIDCLLKGETMMLDEVLSTIESRHLKVQSFDDLQYIVTKASMTRNNQLF